MEINLELLVEYYERLHQNITVYFNIDTVEPVLIFQKGKQAEYGGTRIYLDFEDFKKILLINKILGESGKINQERELLEQIPLEDRGPHLEKFTKTIEKYIYETLSKYIFQMLNGGSIEKIYFPEILQLEEHYDYFRNC